MDEDAERSSPRFQRVMLKLSGEALGAPPHGQGVDPKTLSALAEEVASVHRLGVQVGIVIGGGNIFRGLKGQAQGMDRASADYMGMLATVINGLALQDALEKVGVETRVLSALEIRQVAETYIRRRAMRHLEKGRVVIFVAGTGNPFFSTDTAAALRAMEIQADLLCKATKVAGVYDRDPSRHADARLYHRLSYDRALAEHLGVMDATAIALCRDHGLPIRVFPMTEPGAVRRVVAGEDVGTLVTDRDEEASAPVAGA